VIYGLGDCHLFLIPAIVPLAADLRSLNILQEIIMRCGIKHCSVYKCSKLFAIPRINSTSSMLRIELLVEIEADGCLIMGW
jgi:hypothetical protein